MTGNNGKRVSVLGSTGSIGTQTLDTLSRLEGYSVSALAAGKNAKLMEEQVRAFCPKLAVMKDEDAARELRERVADTGTKVASGETGLIDAAELDSDVLISSIVGTAGLRPTMAAIRCGGRRIALANKETLVCAGTLFTAAVKEYGCELIPVDSEHSAIFQCLMSGRKSEVKRILLTASGGPFLDLTKDELRTVTKERALRHPNWSMGAKITIDSATMMNKGLEVIEAMHLFSVRPDMIKVLVHPQSIVHSAVEFCDNAIIAQMGTPDMRIPIQLALTYPERLPSPAGSAELADIGTLTFREPDLDKFGCLKLALSVAGRQDAAPAVMNAANEEAVMLFLDDRVGFCDICDIVAEAVNAMGTNEIRGIDDVLMWDAAAREFVRERA